MTRNIGNALYIAARNYNYFSSVNPDRLESIFEDICLMYDVLDNAEVYDLTPEQIRSYGLDLVGTINELKVNIKPGRIKREVFNIRGQMADYVSERIDKLMIDAERNQRAISRYKQQTRLSMQ